ncbi:MAG: tRNA (adenosine(37)-N6)-dimethylallyltransferase MiaA [Bacteroidales bacterium]|nr:tRNA (adenosine(37)-N6)-dimethylallyltransferase MiaA [Bacteroidales bacterium]
MVNRLIVITGPTASGKTKIAAHLATQLNGEILSADSRQVYKGMDIGTGKDLSDYIIDNKQVPYHLIDIVDAGYKYNLYQFQDDFTKAYLDINNRKSVPILCGGSGLYVEAIVNGYKLAHVPANYEFRTRCEQLDFQQLTEELKQFKKLHNVTDIDTKQRLIRALEIEVYYHEHPEINIDLPSIDSEIFVIDISRELRRQRISDRLHQRLSEGMIEEVKVLLEKGVSAETLIYYGLEYKFITQFIQGHFTYNEMVSSLEIAIHQFAKRQMTWFRGMERRGIKLNWINGDLPLDDKIAIIKHKCGRFIFQE